jgi:hypothetical protein
VIGPGAWGQSTGETPETLSTMRLAKLTPCLLGALLALNQPLASADRVPPKAGSTPGTETLAPPRQLKPGEFLWHPEASPRGPMVMVDSLNEQIAYVYRNGILIGSSTVSTGKKGHETPTGVFTILQKHADHYSSVYDNAPMPYMQRLTWSGVALHAGKLPGYPASHGCVRMPYEFARLLYDESSTGITVVVSDEKGFPSTVAHPGLFSPIDTKGTTAIEPDRDGKAFAWQPGLSSEGPASILITGEDRRIRVFRDGVEIGWSLFELQDPTRRLTLHVLTALEPTAETSKSFATGQPVRRWQVVSGTQETSITTDELLSGVHVPEEFLRHVATVVEPGTTIVVTQLAASGVTTGQDITVMTADEPSAK